MWPLLVTAIVCVQENIECLSDELRSPKYNSYFVCSMELESQTISDEIGGRGGEEGGCECGDDVNGTRPSLMTHPLAG